jgi:hypothetical protein
VKSPGTANTSSAGRPSSAVWRMPAKARVVGASTGAFDEQMDPSLGVDLGREEERRLALGHRVQALRVRGITLRQRRELLRILEKQVQPIARGRGGELIIDPPVPAREDVDAADAGETGEAVVMHVSVGVSKTNLEG